MRVVLHNMWESCPDYGGVLINGVLIMDVSWLMVSWLWMCPDYGGVLIMDVSWLWCPETQTHCCIGLSSTRTINSRFEGMFFKTSCFSRRRRWGANSSCNFFTCSSFDMSWNSSWKSSRELKVKTMVTKYHSITMQYVGKYRLKERSKQEQTTK